MCSNVGPVLYAYITRLKGKTEIRRNDSQNPLVTHPESDRCMKPTGEKFPGTQVSDGMFYFCNIICVCVLSFYLT